VVIYPPQSFQLHPGPQGFSAGRLTPVTDHPHSTDSRSREAKRDRSIHTFDLVT
jgi:hypothetical protein